MTRTRRAALVLPALAVLALAACAGRAGAGGQVGETGSAGPTAIASAVQWVGIAPELVYVTEIDGFELAQQSVGVVGDDGMSAAYVRVDGDSLDTIMLTTSRDPAPSVVACAELPDSAEPMLRCAVGRDAAQILLEGDGVEPATLRAAAAAVRVPRTDELGDLFAELPTPGPPVERGDLPPHGDGAPLDPPALGG